MRLFCVGGNKDAKYILKELRGYGISVADVNCMAIPADGNFSIPVSWCDICVCLNSAKADDWIVLGMAVEAGKVCYVVGDAPNLEKMDFQRFEDVQEFINYMIGGYFVNKPLDMPYLV